MAVVSSLPPTVAAYDLHHVNGIQAFTGSDQARELLAKNGFVVADPSFKQIFQAYIESPQTKAPSETNWNREYLPSFITTDSAWDTYHVLLEEGVKQMETAQAGRLLAFSRQLLTATKTAKADPDLLLFSSVALALQDTNQLPQLGADEKRIVDGLRAGTLPVAVPIGFDLAPAQFRAQSFYAQSPELSAYFAARQWYANVVFRLANPRETKLAVYLATMVSTDPALLRLWKQLSEPYDQFLAPTEDGTVPEYFAAAISIVGTNNSSPTDSQIADLKRSLAGRLPLPRVSDQLVSPEQYLEFGKATRGFRMLPSRPLPCEVCFHNTVDPKVPGRMYPSGLDFLAASPVLRSPAAVRAVQGQFGKATGDLILKAACGPMPDSLYGDAMQLLASLQQPLPSQAPACLRNDAWQDAQLWTQLGAWAEQQHTWALHSKMTVMVMGLISPPKGIVAPYPGFFTGLAKLSRQTADAFAKANLEPGFEVKTAAGNLLNLLELSSQISRSRDEKEIEAASDKLEQLSEFESRYYDQHRTEWESNGASHAYNRMQENLEDLARRCATNGPATESDSLALRMFSDSRHSVSSMLNDFAPVCERLAALAGKSLNGVALTEDDAKWIENYGVTLAGFHFYYGNSYEVPRDDFPIVTRVFSNPLSDSLLYAGLARPQALYLIIPYGKSLQLYRGAVMTYREFVRPNSQLLDDESWRELVSQGQTPPAPPFTRSFSAEKSVADWMKELRARLGQQEDYDQQEELFWQLGSQATDKDLPGLISLLATSTNSDEDVTVGIANLIERLQWEPYQKRLVHLLSSPDTLLSDFAADILLKRPEHLDAAALASDFDRQSIRARRLYCLLLGSVPQQTVATRQTLLNAVQNPEASVRWQAALAIGKAHWTNEPPISRLFDALNDTNQFVAAAAVRSLALLGATNLAPALLSRLETCLQSPGLSPETRQQQAEAISQEKERIYRPVGGMHPGLGNLLDTDGLELRLRLGGDTSADAVRMAAMRLPPRPFNFPTHHYDLATALIEALGDLHYAPAADEFFKLCGTDYDAEATRALAKLAPARLTDNLMATAKDQQVDSFLREKALVSLGTLSLTNRVRELIPLLDDTTPIVYSKPLPGGKEWRICDRAASTIAVLLQWETPMTASMSFFRQNGETTTRVREWAKQAQ